MPVRSVIVLTLHPNGMARRSQRSLEPRGQIFGEDIGANMGRRDGLGTQVEDCGQLGRLISSMDGLGDVSDIVR